MIATPYKDYSHRDIESVYDELNKGAEKQSQLEERLISILPFLHKDKDSINIINKMLGMEYGIEYTNSKTKKRKKIPLFTNTARGEYFFKALHEIKDNQNFFMSSNDYLLKELAKQSGQSKSEYESRLNNYYDGENWSEMLIMFNNLTRNAQIKSIIQSFSEHFANADLSNPDTLVEYQIEMQGKLEQIFRIQGKSMEWIYDTIRGMVDNRQATDKMPRVMPIGYQKIDEKLHQGGVLPGDLVIIGARPAVGKTALITNIASNISKLKINPLADEDKMDEHEKIKNRYRIAFFSLEMRKDQINDRLTAINTGIKTKELIHPDDLQQSIINKWLSVVKDERQEIYVDDTSEVNMIDIENTLKQAKSEDNPFSLILVDYLQLLNPELSARDERVAISTATKGLKNLAKKYNVGVIALAQLSRDADPSDANRQITLSMLKGSGSIEQDADVILMLSRDDFYDDDANPMSIAKIHIAKNRDGASGSVKLKYYKQYQLMESISDEELKQMEHADQGGDAPVQQVTNQEMKASPNQIKEDREFIKNIQENKVEAKSSVNPIIEKLKEMHANEN